MAGLPDALDMLTGTLSPAYQRHAIVERSEVLLVSIKVAEACETVRGLLACVAVAMDAAGERAEA
jgi:hypothetical protein